MGKRVERVDSSRANYSVDLKLRSQAPMEKNFCKRNEQRAKGVCSFDNMKYAVPSPGEMQLI